MNVTTRTDTVPHEAVNVLAHLVETYSGLRFHGSRRTELASKASRAFAESGCATWEVYLARLSNPVDGAPLAHLLETLTVGETYFFRHRAYFDLLEQQVLPEIIARRRETRQLRLWCAGCATGEEAYSLAILVWHLLPDIESWRISILGTDLNRAFLARAETAVYGEWSFRETDETFKAKHFTREGKRYRLRPELRRLVRFAPLNLAEDRYASPVDGTAAVDVILCRNVLIYFAPEVSRQVVERLRASLAPGGWLILGPSDPLPGILIGFETHTAPDAVIYRRSEGMAAPREPREPELSPASYDRQLRLPGKSVATPVPAPVPLAPTVMDAPANADWQADWRAAQICANQGRLDEAEVRCRQAIARARRRPEPYHLLGTLREAQGDDDGALLAYRQALYVDQGFAPGHLALAAIHRRAGREDQACQALARVQRLLEGRPASEVLLAEEGLTVGRLRDAVALVQALEKQSAPGART